MYKRHRLYNNDPMVAFGSKQSEKLKAFLKEEFFKDKLFI
jgi:hypothetical protein